MLQVLKTHTFLRVSWITTASNKGTTARYILLPVARARPNPAAACQDGLSDFPKCSPGLFMNSRLALLMEVALHLHGRQGGRWLGVQACVGYTRGCLQKPATDRAVILRRVLWPPTSFLDSMLEVQGVLDVLQSGPAFRMEMLPGTCIFSASLTC